MENKTTLYIATHNTTGLKYFGMTKKHFTEESLQMNYHGSGKDWLLHLEEFGDDVNMKLFGIFEESEVEHIARTFSAEHNIKDSLEWANLKPETGKPGGRCPGTPLTEETKEKLRQANLGKRGYKHTKEAKQKISDRFKGKHLSKEHCVKLSEAHLGKTLTEEHKNKISNSLNNMDPLVEAEWKRKCREAGQKGKGIKRKKIQCPHCGLIGGNGAMKRYHFDNCKHKEKEVV